MNRNWHIVVKVGVRACGLTPSLISSKEVHLGWRETALARETRHEVTDVAKGVNE